MTDTDREALIARLRKWPQIQCYGDEDVEAAADMLAEDGRLLEEWKDGLNVWQERAEGAEARERALREAFMWLREGFKRHGAEAGLTGGGPCGCPRCENLRRALAASPDRGQGLLRNRGERERAQTAETRERVLREALRRIRDETATQPKAWAIADRALADAFGYGGSPSGIKDRRPVPPDNFEPTEPQEDDR